jgi:hypothetical protein
MPIEAFDPGTEHEAWRPPPADERAESTYRAAVGDMGDVEVFRQSYDIRDRLVDFAVIQKSWHNGHLVTVAEADIRHGELHVHIYDQKGERIAREVIRPVSSQKDVEDCYDAALAWFDEKWEHCKWRWRRG